MMKCVITDYRFIVLKRVCPMTRRSRCDMLLKRRYQNYSKVRHFSLVPEIRCVMACTSHLAEFHASAWPSARNFQRNITRRHGAVLDRVANTRAVINFCPPINIVTNSRVNECFAHYGKTGCSYSINKWKIISLYCYLWFYVIFHLVYKINLRYVFVQKSNRFKLLFEIFLF